MTKEAKPLVLLMGPPNVGKSVLFNFFTGMSVSCANYPGTTVEYAFGKADIEGTEITLIDVPGTYTLDAENEAEKIAVEMLSGNYEKISASSCHQPKGQFADLEATSQKPTAVLCVLDASNLGSSLYLLLQVMEFGLPVVAALNRTDLIQERGKMIDTALLSEQLGIPVIATVAVKNQGLEELTHTLAKALNRQPGKHPVTEPDDSKRWLQAEELACATTREEPACEKSQRSYSARKKWGLLLVKPWPGIPLAILILSFLFLFVIGVGMGLRQFLLLPLFRELIIPQIVIFIQALVPPGVVQNIIIGEYGFLVKGLEWPFTLVLPYVISFYTALTILEDSGYMSRLGALLDGLLNRVGLHGSSVIPLLLGYGCAVPAILSTRALNSRKERLTVSTMICLAIPCVAQTGAFISLLAERSILLVLLLFALSFMMLAGAGLVLDRLVKGSQLQTVMELPALLAPRGDVLAKKLWVRLKNFVTDGALPMVGAVGVAALLYETGIMEALGIRLRFLVTGWLGLPQEATVPLILGVLRRELTVLPLLEMELTMLQLFVGASVALFYVPCIAIIGTLIKEFSIYFSLGMLLLTSSLAFLAGGIILRIGQMVLALVT